MRNALVLIVTSACLTGCTATDDSESGSIAADTAPAAAVFTPPPPPDTTALAQLRDSAGHDLGTLTLTNDTAGIAVTGTLRGLPPGTHALHLHAVGVCEPPFQSAGGHWNPTNRQHGLENPAGPHLGDLRNITVANDSTVSVSAATPGGRLHDANGLLDADGAAVVVHAGADDYRSDPAGNAGARIACGVVQLQLQP